MILKCYSHQQYINTGCYFKFRKTLLHSHFCKIISQNAEYVKTFCNDLNNYFHFACRKWTNQLN